MINLLPVSEKQNIAKIYHLRVAAVCMALAAGVLVVSLVAMVPSYLSAKTKYDSADGLSKIAKDQATSASQADMEKVVTSANEKISALQGVSDSDSVRELTTKILAAKGPQVRLTGLSFDLGASVGAKGAQSAKKISVQGVSQGREDLIAFVDALNTEKQFTSVDLPISNFVKEKNIDFAINITLAP